MVIWIILFVRSVGLYKVETFGGGSVYLSPTQRKVSTFGTLMSYRIQHQGQQTNSLGTKTKSGFPFRIHEDLVLQNTQMHMHVCRRA